MKAIVIRTNLKEGLLAAERAEGSATSLPILKNVLLETENNKIRLVATNLEIAISCLVSGKTLEEGKVTVPLGTLAGIINNLQSERLNLEKKGNNLEIKSDNYRATLQGLPAEDFPLVPKIKNPEGFLEIKAETLKDAIGQVVVATQASDLRPELNSMLFDFSLDTIKLAATDSFRLAEKSIPNNEFESSHAEEFRALIPLKTAQELLRVLKGEEAVKIYHDQNQVLFKTDQTEIISRLLEGSFPDYAAIVPKKFGAEIVVDRQELINAIKLASVFGSRTNEVKITLSDNKKTVEISSADQAVGENAYLLPAKAEGKTGEIIFNWRYLLDALRALKTEDVFLGLNEEGEPALIRSTKEGSYFYILKPILKT